jgi:hypothetical protein
VRENAVILSELVLRPIESPLDDCLWEATDRTQYGTAALAAKCSALLEAQIVASGLGTPSAAG